MTQVLMNRSMSPGRQGIAPFAHLGVALLYFATAQGGLTFAVVGGTVTLVWPPSGIALVAILAFGYRMAYGIAVGAFLVNAWTDVPLAVAGGIAVGNTFEALAGGWLLRRLAGFRATLERRRDVFALICLAAGLATVISACIGVTALTVGGVVHPGDFFPVWLKWWLGDMMGVLVVAPPLLVWLSHPRPRVSFRLGVEAVALLATLLSVGYAIFLAPDLAAQGYYPAALAVFPFVIWGALRFELWGATLVTLVVALLAILGTTQGTGPFAVDSPVDSLVRWCTFANVVAITGLLLAALGAEQRRAQQALRDSHDELERRVAERTDQLACINAGLKKEMAERKRLAAELIRAEENQQRAVGRELHDGLGQQLTSIAFFGATLRQQLEEQARPEADAARRIVELIGQATETVRAVARGLYPAVLEFGGLRAALAQLAANTSSLKGIACEFRADEAIRVEDPLVAINLYRVAQEAVNNAVKHGRVSHMHIELSRIDGLHRLSISDDGTGFDPATIGNGQGMGLHNLRYRAGLLGGELIMNNNRQGGTTVAVVYPAQGRT